MRDERTWSAFGSHPGAFRAVYRLMQCCRKGLQRGRVYWRWTVWPGHFASATCFRGAKADTHVHRPIIRTHCQRQDWSRRPGSSRH
jgi:hypothetical protein